jgi:HlyD family secretion protein
MAGTPSVAVLRDIQTLFDAGTGVGLTDRQLLERFANRRDASSDAAFEVLILRHGPMVLRVCRNLLRDEADVADAFQATFLVLVRKRETVRRLESVGGWLYGVACRVAARARVDAARRQKAERRAALRVVEAVDQADGNPVSRDFGPVVQEEVRRLPEKYRAVVVLCYWQSLTNEQAAAQLGCPLGTVHSRLRRARKLLHRRLTRRGLAPIAGVVATALEGSSASGSTLAAVPQALMRETIQAASAAASGQALNYVVSSATASLVQRVLWSMAMIKIKLAAVGLALVGFVGLGVAAVTVRGQQAQAKPPANAVAAEPRSGPLKDPQGKSLIYALQREPTSLIFFKPSGSIVKKGELVSELDSAALRDALTDQWTVLAVAESTYRNRVKASEIAELSLKEYGDTWKAEFAEAEATILRAESELAAAVNAEESGKKNEPGILPRRAAMFALEAAQMRKKALVDHSRPRRVKELELAIAVANTEEKASKAAWDLELKKEKRLEGQIMLCKILAPRDGMLIHAEPLEEGGVVQPHQLLFKIVPVLTPKPGAQ